MSEVLAGLNELGVGSGDHVGLLASNRIEWHLADHAVLANGGVTVPVYLTSSAEQVRYILRATGQGAPRAARATQEEKLEEKQGANLRAMKLYMELGKTKVDTEQTGRRFGGDSAVTYACTIAPSAPRSGTSSASINREC